MTFKIERARRGGIANEEEGGTRNNSGIRKSELRKKKKWNFFSSKYRIISPKVTQNIDKYSTTMIRSSES